MYHAIKSQEVRKVLSVEGPALVLAIAIAGLFYKFGSFILELFAFLPTWFAISYAISRIGRRMGIITD